MKPASPYAVVEQPAFSYTQFPLLTSYPYLSRGREGSERGKTHLDPRESGFRVSPLVYPSVGMGLYRGQWTLAKAPPSRITVFAHALLPVPRRLSPHSYRLGLGRFPRSLSTQLRRPFRAVYLSPVGGDWLGSESHLCARRTSVLAPRNTKAACSCSLVVILSDSLSTCYGKRQKACANGLNLVLLTTATTPLYTKKRPDASGRVKLLNKQRRTPSKVQLHCKRFHRRKQA
jgi:hypothetical protein